MLTKKSPVIAFLLALVFGPVGMIYVSFSLGFLYFLANCVFIFTIAGAPLVVASWLIGVIHATRLAASHNANLLKLVRG